MSGGSPGRCHTEGRTAWPPASGRHSARRASAAASTSTASSAQLVALERGRSRGCRRRQRTLQTQLSAFGKIKTLVAPLRDAARTLASRRRPGAQTIGSLDRRGGRRRDRSAARLPGSYAVRGAEPRRGAVGRHGDGVPTRHEHARRRHAAHRARQLGRQPPSRPERRHARSTSTIGPATDTLAAGARQDQCRRRRRHRARS